MILEDWTSTIGQRLRARVEFREMLRAFIHSRSFPSWSGASSSGEIMTQKRVCSTFSVAAR